MNNKFSPWFLMASVSALLAGGLIGYFLPDVMLSISFIGKLFLNGLKIIVIPFVLALIITEIASMGDIGKIKRSLGKTIGYFGATSALAAVFGIIMTFIIQPGIGMVKDNAHIPEEIIPKLNSFSVNEFLGSIVPGNFLTASTEIQIFVIILFSFLIGVVLTKYDRTNKVVLDFFKALHSTLSGLMKYILYIVPVGLFSLCGTAFAEYAGKGDNVETLFANIALLTVTLIVSFSFFALVLLPIVMRIFTHISPYKYFTSLLPALSTAFATDSAIASLPITGECIQEKKEIDNRASAFVLPLGALFNSSGTALFLSVSVVFIAQMYGISLSIAQIAAMLGGSLVISIFASFIPYSSLLMIALLMNIAQIPVHATAGIGLLVVVDFLFSRLRTVVNVWGDAVGTAVIAETFDFKTARTTKTTTTSKRTYTKDKSKPARTPRKKDSYTTKSTSVKPKRESSRTDRKPKPEPKKRVSDQKTKPSKPAAVKKAPITSQSPFVMPEAPFHILETELKPKIKKTEREPSKPKTKPAPVRKPKLDKQEIKATTPVFKHEVKTKAEETSSVEEDSVITKVNNILSQETIERERAKITAQLNSMRNREISLDEDLKKEPLVSEPIQETKTEQSEQIVEPDITEQPSDDFTKIDFFSEEPKTAEPQTEVIVPPPVEAESKTEKREVEVSENESIETSVEAVEEPVEVLSEPVATDNIEPEPVAYGRSRSKRGQKTSPDSEESVDSDDKGKQEVFDKTDYSVENMSFGRGKKKK